MEEKWINNSVELCGTLGGKPEFSHMSREEAYYLFPLEIERLSGAVDRVNVLARESLLQALPVQEGSKILINGELRSFNNKSGQGSRLVITIFTRGIKIRDGEDSNEVVLKGVLCKPPNLRTTPMGREICDLMLAVSRRYGRSDYIPCIAWGQNAREAGDWAVGTPVALTGRIQSRQYVKMQDGNSVEKTAYEVSAVALQQLQALDEDL